VTGIVRETAVFDLTTLQLDDLALVKRAAPVVLLALFWGWESWRPFFGHREGRYRHAAHNLAIALVNTLVLGLLFGAVTVMVTDWTQQNRYGLLNVLGLAGPVQFLLALVLLDGWMYLWHRANHAIPLLWRFHRMHHSDPHMDVTTATRFHFGEHVGSSLLRLGLIPLLGFGVWHLIVYETLVIAIIMFHHADISLGRFDRWLRLLIVTPDMHKVHHSDWRPETDSNYSTVLSVWDRLAGSFRMRDNPGEIVFGLREFPGSRWQSFAGMWATPFVHPVPDSRPVRTEPAREESLV
jgi:sterol desaturase/sphingolipid hydroxylase (fatty acid hydroxylase superfamily)